MSLFTRLFKIQFSYKNSKGVRYHLFYADVVLRGGKSQRIYFFNRLPLSSYTGKPRHPAYELPKGGKVNENPRNGFLIIGFDDDEHYTPDERED